jgi:mannose-6-phosphate isomerase-like protein (cupin superfamily)
VTQKASLPQLLSSVTYLPNRTPEMAFNGGAAGAFAEVAAYRDGAIYTGHYSGSSEWERHPEGDEIVMALDGTTTVVLLQDGAKERIPLGPGELVVVPRGRWHRFENSDKLKVFTVTPQPTEHSLTLPEE